LHKSRRDITKEDLALIVKLKKIFQITDKPKTAKPAAAASSPRRPPAQAAQAYDAGFIEEYDED